jgi:hypothetical protein
LKETGCKSAWTTASFPWRHTVSVIAREHCRGFAAAENPCESAAAPDSRADASSDRTIPLQASNAAMSYKLKPEFSSRQHKDAYGEP